MKSFSRTFYAGETTVPRGVGVRVRNVRLSLLSICGCVFVSKAVNENCRILNERKSAGL